MHDNPLRIINGYDSFGNICGFSENSKWEGIDESSKNTEHQKNVFYFDTQHWFTLKLCVADCPSEDIVTIKDLQLYTMKHNISYCYNFNVSQIDGNSNDSDPAIFSSSGPCPKLPINQSSPIMNRCVPNGDVRELNEKFDLLEETGIALYTTRTLISLIVILSIVLSILMLIFLPKIGSHLSCIFAILTCTATSVFLWYTYYGIKQNSEEFQLPGVWRNEIAVLIVAIIVSILTIVLYVKTHLKRSNFAELAKVFDEAKECIADLPGS